MGSRAVIAGGLLVALLAVLLGAWFVSGWHDVRMRQGEVRAAPRAAASARVAELGRELHGELEALLAREVRRPYFHYQNLMHDPKSSAGLSVSPSPLARGSEDKWVVGYFQIDAKGRTTTPTINDEVPELSEPEQLATNRAFRDQVNRELASALTPGATIVAQAPVAATQQQTIDSNSYTQNTNSNAVYWYQLDNANDVKPRVAVTVPPPNAATQITITVSPLEWRTLLFGGVPTLVAVRNVQTPDGMLSQGFVVDRATLTGWLAGKAGELVAELHAGVIDPTRPPSESSPFDTASSVGSESGRTEIASSAGSESSRTEIAPSAASARGRFEFAHEVAPGWQLTVSPNPRTLARAAGDASSVARDFILRFVVVGVIAALTAALVLLLVIRAEKLARERSQFAAAAAHELRTPLAGLQLYGDMLADGLGDPNKLRDYARRMSEEAARLGRVVSNVLGFSQLERGNLAVAAKVGPLGEALCELAERAEPALDRAGAVLDLDVARDLTARFDKDALARIVGNLLDNAEKYTRDTAKLGSRATAEPSAGAAFESAASSAGGRSDAEGDASIDRTICLAARTVGDRVEVIVRDKGPGIADPARLFKPFERGVPVDGPAGLGLGLALSHSLAHAMGGTLSYRTAEGGGAELVLSLKT